MLEIIRQYAFEKLDQAEEVERVRHQHLAYYTELAQNANARWYTQEQANLIRRFDAEYPNLRLALTYGLEQSQEEKDLLLGIQLASALGPFWNLIAEYNEAQMWLKKALDKLDSFSQMSPGRERLLPLRAKALYEYGFLVWFQSNYDKAREIFLECSRLDEELQD